ncbi:MAG: glycine cleavage system protein GcvH [Thermogutta sp.]|nr:glycine cleavage system protein GcvH [Thermogutta sp.]
MSDVQLSDYKFSTTHEWVKLSQGDQGESIATVGITDHAVQALADLVFIELPPIGKELQAGEPFGQIESVKAVSDLYSPVSGTVIETNAALAERVESLPDDPYQAGWMIRLRLSRPEELENLLDQAAYEKLCAGEAEADH